ncbi:hypothetical protein [Candidatus Nitrospira bockiana]
MPQKGCAYSGGEWTVAIGGTRGVFVQTAEADFDPGRPASADLRSCRTAARTRSRPASAPGGHSHAPDRR